MWAAIKSLPARAKYGFDSFLTGRCGFSPRQRHLTYHYLELLRDQVFAVIPIAVVQVRFTSLRYPDTVEYGY